MERLSGAFAAAGAVAVESAPACADQGVSAGGVLVVVSKPTHDVLLHGRSERSSRGAVVGDSSRSSLVSARRRRKLELGRCRSEWSRARGGVHPFAVDFKLTASGRVSVDTLDELESRREVPLGSTVRSADTLSGATRKSRLRESSLDTKRPQVPVESSRKRQEEEAFSTSRRSVSRSVVGTDPAVSTKHDSTLPLVKRPV